MDILRFVFLHSDSTAIFGKKLEHDLMRRTSSFKVNHCFGINAFGQYCNFMYKNILVIGGELHLDE